MSKRRTALSNEEITSKPLALFENEPVVKDLMSDKFVKGTNSEATEIAIALRLLINGQDTLLQNQQKQSEEMSRIREKMAKMDADAERWETDRQRFEDEINAKADSLRTRNPDTIVANGAIEMQNAIVQARAEIHTDRMKFHEMLNRMPKVMVVSPGELVQVMEGGRPVNKIMPETIRIKDMVWSLKPGDLTEVPEIVAAALRDRRRSEEEQRVREDMLSKNYEQPVLQRKWAEANQLYKSPTQ
jgi:hypothetical protein